jgi:asparagine synthase (glutamine-hydrolysing)
LNGLCAGKWYQADLGSKLQKLGLALRHDSIWRMYRSLLACWEDPGLFLGPVSEPKTVMDGVGQSGHSDPIMTFLFWDSVFYLPDDNLTRVDRASMAVSLEMRVPLLDHTIAEQVWRMPDRLRTEAHKSKWLLRQVLYRYVPPQLIERPKKGFSVPLAEWLRGPLRSWAEDLLFSGGSDSDGLIRTAEVRKRWREHIEGRRDWNLVLWALICLRAWQADVRR